MIFFDVFNLNKKILNLKKNCLSIKSEIEMSSAREEILEKFDEKNLVYIPVNLGKKFHEKTQMWKKTFNTPDRVKNYKKETKAIKPRKLKVCF